VDTAVKTDKISAALKHIMGYHQNRIGEIEIGHASVDKDEAKKIETSKTFSAEAHRFADMNPGTETALTRLSEQAADMKTAFRLTT